MFFHAPNQSAIVIVKSIMGLGLCKQNPACWLLHTGKGMNIHAIDLQMIQQQLGDAFTDSLIGLHAMSGCDSACSLYGKGKVKTARLLYANNIYLYAVGSCG